MKKITPFLLALLLPLNALLAGCGVLFPTVEPVNLSFALPADDQAYYESLLAEFAEDYPNITITFQPYEDDLPRDADAIVLPWLYTQGNPADELGLLPIDEYLSQEKDFSPDLFFPGALDAFSANGKQYAVPLGVDPWVMYYNKDLFDAAGVPYPQSGWTWSDFLVLGQSLRSEEGHTYGYTQATTSYVDAMMFVFQHGGNLVDANGQPTFTDPLAIEAIEWYVNLFREYHVAPTDRQAQSDYGPTNNAGFLGVVSGKVGMFISALSSRGGRTNFPAAWRFNWGLVELPRDQAAFTIAFFEGGAIPATSAHPNEAWKWLAFISRKPHNRLVPARVELAESDEFKQLVGEDVALAGRAAVNSAMFVNGKVVSDLSDKIDIFTTTVSTLVNQEDLNVAEAMQEAQVQAEQR